MRTESPLSNESLIFNLGRLWQEVISEHWDEATYLYKFIQEIASPHLLKKHSKGLKRLQLAIEWKDCEAVDKALEVILKW